MDIAEKTLDPPKSAAPLKAQAHSEHHTPREAAKSGGRRTWRFGVLVDAGNSPHFRRGRP